VAIDIGQKVGPLPAWTWGAVIVIGGYGVYYLRSKATSDTGPVQPDNGQFIDPAGEETFAGSGVGTGGSGGADLSTSLTENALSLASDNVSWARQVAALMIAKGYDPIAVDSAIAKWLSGATLNPAESAVRRVVEMLYGEPPEGISPAPTGTPGGTPGAPVAWTHRHKVLPGETWASIAAGSHVTEGNLWNHNPTLHRPGHKLTPGWIMLTPAL
jgi:hypothetical protein